MIVWDGSRIDGKDGGLRSPCRDAERGTRRTRRRPRSGWREVSLGRLIGRWVRAGSTGKLPEGWSDWVWNGSQSGQSAIELGFPGPALGKMQGEAARRAGEPPGDREEPPPEGLGGSQLLTQADARCPAGQVMGHHLDRQPGGVGGETARGEMVETDAVLEVSDGILDLGVTATTAWV